MLWTFGFDTVYAMANRRDDAALGLRSSALSSGLRPLPSWRFCYGPDALVLALRRPAAGVLPYLPLWAWRRSHCTNRARCAGSSASRA